MRLLAASIACASVLGACCAAAAQGEPETHPATAPAATKPADGPATKPATTTAPVDIKPEDILKDLEKAGEKYTTIKAEFSYEVVNRLLGDKERRTGWVAYQKGEKDSPSRFRFHFATLRLDEGKEFEEKLDYAFDGKRLSIARHKIKQIQRYRIPAEHRRQPMKLGEGPFPMPFGQKAEDVMENFRLTARVARGKEPEGTDYLRLLPKEEDADDLNIERIEMWVDRKIGLPVKIVSVGRNRNVTTLNLSMVETNVELDKNTFKLSKPLGWRESIENLEKGAKLSP